jgi:large subunit ribosomal protein L25
MVMKVEKLQVRFREKVGTNAARRERRQGRIPAIVYGGDGPPRPVSVEAKQMLGYLTEGRRIFDVELPQGKSERVIVRDLQYDTFGEHLIHLDFERVKAGEKVTVEVPIKLVGEAEGVRRGGVLEQHLDELEIRSDPAMIPQFIEVNISELGLGDSLHVEELKVPEGVEVLSKADAVVVTIALPVEEEVVLAPAEEAVSGEPEVVTERKEEKEEEE